MSSGSGSSSTITATFSSSSANSSGSPSRACSTRASNSSGGIRMAHRVPVRYTAAMSVRLDKWLHVARVYQTRTQATHAVDLNRVRVNGQTAKPHRNLVVGDRIDVEIGDWNRVLIVKGLRDKPVSKEEGR